jgi:hypothetical protein
MRIVLRRTDFTLYSFDYILHVLRVPEEDWEKVEEIDLEVKDFALFPSPIQP